MLARERSGCLLLGRWHALAAAAAADSACCSARCDAEQVQLHYRATRKRPIQPSAAAVERSQAMRQGSFVRKGAALAADPGTRPGLHGQTLVSSGHADLDRLLGGGLPLGSLLLLLEDGWSGHHATLLRYFLAEGAACGQSLLLAAAPAPPGGLAKFVPAQLKGGRAADKDEEGGGNDQDEFKLRIAWQYRRYIRSGTGQPDGSMGTAAAAATRRAGRANCSSSGSGVGMRSRGGAGSSGGDGSGAPRRPVGMRDWCSQFDLLKPVGEEGLQQCRAELADCSSSGNSSVDASFVAAASGTQRLLGAAAAFVQSLAPPQQEQPVQQPGAAGARSLAAPVPPRGPQHVGRIAVLSLGGLGWQASAPPPSSSGSDGDDNGMAVVRALLQLKAVVRDRRCTAVVSAPAALFSASDLARMQHIADGVIALESVADDSDLVRLAPDAASVAGLLHLRKLPALGTLVPPAIEVALHLVRHKRRRLSITSVEIDPDAEMADAEAASGAGKSVASMLCGGPPSASRAVDF